MLCDIALNLYEYHMCFSFVDNGENDTECTPRSVDNFPGNFLTLKQTQDGAVFIHILLALYLFGALAIICDDYFVASLEVICDGR